MPGRRELWCTCGRCQWTWSIYGPLPAPLEVVAKAMKQAKCPNCPPNARGTIYMAKEADIQRVMEAANG